LVKKKVGEKKEKNTHKKRHQQGREEEG